MTGLIPARHTSNSSPSLPSTAAQGNKEVHTESGEHLRAKNHKLLTGKNLQDHLVLTDEVTRTQ